MEKKKAYRRHQRNRWIARRLTIYTRVWGWEFTEFKNGVWYIPPKGRYHKGKVHCSCSSCSPKRKVFGPRWREQVQRDAQEREWKSFKQFGLEE